MGCETLHVNDAGRVFVRSVQGLTTIDGGQRIFYWPTALRVYSGDCGVFHGVVVTPLGDGQYRMEDGTHRLIRCRDGGRTVAERFEDVVVPRPAVSGKMELRWDFVGAGQWQKRGPSTNWQWTAC